MDPAAPLADEDLAINLKLYSPSDEVEGGLILPDLRASTTVRELRTAIHDAVATRPATERMRLIYRGRVVSNDDSTLLHVFGAENIRQSKDQNLHLVLREPPINSPASSSSPSSLGSRSSTAPPPNPFRPAQPPTPASPALQTNPFRTIPQPRPESQPQLLPHHHHHHHHHPYHPHMHAHPHPPTIHQHQHHLPPHADPYQVAGITPLMQQHLAAALAAARAIETNNNGPTAPHAQQPSSTTVTPPRNGAPPNPTGLPSLPGFTPQNGPPNIPGARRQEGVSLDGSRWSVTTFTASRPASGQPQQPNAPPAASAHNASPSATALNSASPAFGSNPPPPASGPNPPPSAILSNAPLGLPSPPLHRNFSPWGEADDQIVDLILSDLRPVLENARSELANMRTLAQSPAGGDPPVWRLGQMHLHMREMQRNLDLLQRGVSFLEIQSPYNEAVVTLSGAATELRRQYETLTRIFITQHNAQNRANPGERSSSNSGIADVPAQSTEQNLPPGAPEELFVLSSPDGPVGVLFNQRGSFTTEPMTLSLPFHAFTNQFAHNREILSGLGRQMARAYTPAATLSIPDGTAQQQPANQAQQQVQPQAQAQNQNQNQNANQNANPQGENDRVGNIAGHLWLLIKLAFFVYFLSGSGGWYKSIMLGIIAGGIYLAQLGIFDEQFNLVRRHFEAVLPVGALAERVVQGRNANANPQAQRAEPGRNPTPEEAARRLLGQRRNERLGWARETLRSIERAFAIFIASLWPGIGERMVHAQEERERAERVAEEERQRLLEETQQREAEAEAQTRAEEEKREEEMRDANGRPREEQAGSLAAA